MAKHQLEKTESSEDNISGRLPKWVITLEKLKEQAVEELASFHE